MDEMQVGELIPLPDGWFKDANTGRLFRMDEDGQLVFPFDDDEDGDQE